MQISKEKQLYAVILVLSIASAGMGGYLLSLLQNTPYTHGQHSSPGIPHGGPHVPIIVIGQGQEVKLKTITVTGVGSSAAEPNLAVLRLGVCTQASTASEALAKNAEIMGEVIEALKDIGVQEKDIETSSFSLSPRYTTGGHLIGFEVTHILKVKTANLYGVGQIIDKAVEAGANRVDAVYFTFTKDKLSELETLARQRAVETAKSKAEIIANSLGVKIVGIAEAEELYYRSPYLGPYLEKLAATYIMPPEEVEIEVAIRVTFIIESI